MAELISIETNLDFLLRKDRTLILSAIETEIGLTRMALEQADEVMMRALKKLSDDFGTRSYGEYVSGKDDSEKQYYRFLHRLNLLKQDYHDRYCRTDKGAVYIDAYRKKMGLKSVKQENAEIMQAVIDRAKHLF